MVTREFIRHVKCKTEVLEIGDDFYCPGHDCRRNVDVDETELVKPFKIPDQPREWRD